MSTNNQTNEQKQTLGNEQKQKMKKYAVFALMGIICAGCMWFIFAPSAGEKAKQEQTAGFNADIPMPKNETIIGDKRDAYEQEQMQQKQAERMRSLEDFSSLLGENNPTQTNNLVLLTDEPTSSKASSTPKPTPVQNSVNAYRDINRTLGNFYETPKNDTEKEELKRKIEELQARMDETENRKNAVDEQMALMEKSFQMASRYIPMNAGATNGTTEPAQTATASRKTPVVPVGQVIEQTVSALQPEMSGAEFIETYSQPRNMGFFTATAETSKERKNTISACVHADQTLMDGESVRLRLLEPMRAGETFIRENTILSGFAKIQGERLQISVYSLEYNGNIIPVEMSVYDADGQKGIFIPDTKEINAAKEIAANMGTSAGTSISLSSDAGEQFAADMGRGVDLGSAKLIAGKADGSENVIRVKAAVQGFERETNFSVITDEGSFYSFNVKYADEPEKLNVEMKDFIHDGEAVNRPNNSLDIYMKELGNESPKVVNLIMKSIYQSDKREIKHVGSKRFGIQTLLKGIYTYNDFLYFHIQTKNASQVPFDMDFIRIKIVDKKIAKRTAIQEQVIYPVRAYRYNIRIEGKKTERTVFALPKFTIPDGKQLIVELFEKNGGRHQRFVVENSDIIRARIIDDLKVK